MDTTSTTLSTPAAAPRGAAYHAPALLLFLVLTVLLAFPVVAGLFSASVPGWEGDNMYYVRSMWWVKRALLDLHILPFVDVTSYYPVGHAIARSEMTATNTLLFLPVTAAFGPVVSYDVAVIFSFVATAFGSYLWVHSLTGSRASGLLAGTIIGFLPFRFAHLPGHLPQLTMQWIPLTLYAFERFLERRTAGRAAWMGAGVACVCIGCWYYGYSLALIFPVYVILRTWNDRALWRDRAWWTGIAVSGAVALVIMGPFLWQMVKLRSAGDLRRSLVEIQAWALNFYDPFIPNLIHPLFGETASNWFPHQKAAWPEKVHALGYTAMALAIVGLVQWRRRKPALVAALAGVWIVAYLICLGPFLKSSDHMIRVHVPPGVAKFAASLLRSGGPASPVRHSFIQDGLPIPLPSVFLYKFVPMTTGMRVMARFSIWTALATAALAGFGLITLMESVHRRWGPAARRALPAIAIVLVAFESMSTIPMLAVGPRAVDLWLQQQPDDVVFVELPVEQGTRAFQNYWAIHSERKSLFGWSGDSFSPPVLIERAAALGDFPSTSSIDFLRASSATYVLMTPSQIPNWVTMEPLVNAQPALKHVATFNDVRVYKIVR